MGLLFCHWSMTDLSLRTSHLMSIINVSMQTEVRPLVCLKKKFPSSLQVRSYMLTDKSGVQLPKIWIESIRNISGLQLDFLSSRWVHRVSSLYKRWPLFVYVGILSILLTSSTETCSEISFSHFLKTNMMSCSEWRDVNLCNCDCTVNGLIFNRKTK